MNLRGRSVALLASVLIMVIAAAQQCLCSPVQQLHSRPDFRQLLQEIGHFSPAPCGAAPKTAANDDSEANIEFHLFSQAADTVVRALNEGSSGPPRKRATEALEKLEQMSAEINSSWPNDNRFHSQILDLPPALVVKMSIRADEAFFVFALREKGPQGTGRSWQRVGSNNESREFIGAPSQIDLYPLHRGPSQNARFLSKAIYSGCAGSIGVAYDAREWNPNDTGSLETIIKQEGAFGLDDKVPDFPQIGELRTEGPILTLPYCWFSSIDTWDNPSLCVLDTYDLSGDEVKFRSRTYNRPDLVPIAKAIEYAQKRDYHAVLGYCASKQVARKMVRDIPPDVFSAEGLEVSHTGNGEERVELGGAYRFDVQKRGERWVVVAFDAK